MGVVCRGCEVLGVASLPEYMFNCCSSVRENEQDTFSLGASLGGYRTKMDFWGTRPA